MQRYSQKEIALIKFFSYEELINNESIEPPVLYKMMMEAAFIFEYKGKAVDSLRRCIKAFNDCKVYRNTEEWDDLIEM